MELTSYNSLALPASNDLMMIVDVSDETMSPLGTTKQVQVQNLMLCNGASDWLNVKEYGATGNGQLIEAASMTATSAVLTCSFSIFQSTDVNKLVMVAGAGASGVPLAATVSSYQSGTQVTLSAAASTSVSSAVCYWGTDDSAAFQSALNASQTTVQYDSEFLTSAAQAVYVPYAIYMIGTALTPQQSKSFRILGGGAIIVTPQTSFLNFNAQAALLEGTVEISGLWLDSGGGHIFENANLHGLLHFHHMNMVQRNPNYALFYMDDVARADGHTTALYKATFSYITYWQGPGTRSIEMWRLVSNGSAELTDITWEHINGPNPPGTNPTIDNTKYQYYLTCSGGTNDDISNITWRDILAASFYGGMIKVGAATQVTIENINLYNNYNEAETNDLFAFINDPSSGQPCKYVTIRNVHRNNNLGSAGSPACNDISFTSACSWIHIENYTGPYYGGQGPTIALNGAARAVLMNCGGVAGTVSVTGTSSDTVIIENGVITAGSFATLRPSGDSTGATDAAAINALITAGVQNIILAPGQWYTGTNRISLTSGPGVKILGSGAVMNDVSGTNTNATIINCGLSSSSTGLFFFSHTSSQVSGTEIGNLDIVYSGTGNVFDDVNLQSGYFHDLQISLSQGAAMAFAALTSETSNNSVIQVTFERVTVTNTASSRTNPWVMLQSVNSGGISDVTFLKCKFNNTGQDSAQPCVLVECTTSGAGYHYATTFRDCYFEKPLGGAIKSLSGSGLLVDHCMFWDMSGLTIGGSTIYVGAYSGNIGSQGVVITGCGRNRNGPSGSSYWDVECESTTSQVVVEGFHILANSQSTATDAYFNFHGCNDVILMNNVSPQGSAVNGNSTTVVTNPSPTQVTISEGVITGASASLSTALGISSGGTNVGSLTAYELLAANSSASAVTQIGTGTSGQVLTSNGATALPTFQTFAAASLAGDTDTSISTPATGQVLVYNSSSKWQNMAQWFNVMSFGATGNGTTDDTTAIAAALTAASGGGIVFFPPGTYLISEPLAMTSGITLLGAGSTASVLKGSSSFPFSSQCGAVQFGSSTFTTSGPTITGCRIADIGFNMTAVNDGTANQVNAIFQDYCCLQDIVIERIWYSGQENGCCFMFNGLGRGQSSAQWTYGLTIRDIYALNGGGTVCCYSNSNQSGSVISGINISSIYNHISRTIIDDRVVISGNSAGAGDTLMRDITIREVYVDVASGSGGTVNGVKLDTGAYGQIQNVLISGVHYYALSSGGAVGNPVIMYSAGTGGAVGFLQDYTVENVYALNSYGVLLFLNRFTVAPNVTVRNINLENCRDSVYLVSLLTQSTAVGDENIVFDGISGNSVTSAGTYTPLGIQLWSGASGKGASGSVAIRNVVLTGVNYGITTTVNGAGSGTATTAYSNILVRDCNLSGCTVPVALANTYTIRSVVGVSDYPAVSIAQGGTGQTTAAAALNALTASSGATSGQVLGVTSGVAGWVPDSGVTVKVPAPTGATSTDTSNITTAITSLETALASGPATLSFEDGTYQVDSNSLVIRSYSNFAIKGTGATVISQAPNRSGNTNNVGGDLFIIADCTDFSVTGITFDGLRDTVSPITAITATATSGQATATVASGSGARYIAGQKLSVFGGLGSTDSNKQDVNLTISSISAGGGAGGGDLITFTTNLANTYSQISSTSFSDGFGLYAYAGVYVTPYQTGSATVAGRSLSGEDQQNGLHLISCARFSVSNCESRNLWESPVKCGTGFAATSLTDGCSYGAITNCVGYHGYDQGISLWISKQITVSGCSLNATGWAGVSLSGSDHCSILGNQMVNQYYRVPNDNNSGCGIAIEGGTFNHVRGNVITTPWSDGMRITNSPVGWGQSYSTAPTLSTYLAAQTAAATSVQVSSSSVLELNGLYSIIDGSKTEPVVVASIVDGTHVTFAADTQFSHASGTYLSNRVATDNEIAGNTIYSPAQGCGIWACASARNVISGNTIRCWGLQSSNLYGVNLSYVNYGSANLPSGVYLAGDGTVVEGNIIGGGVADSVYCDSGGSYLVRGNRLSGPAAGAGMALHVKGAVDSDFSGNICTDTEQNSAIYVETGGRSSTIPARCSFAGNVVRRTSNEGMIFLAGTSLTITGNVASSCGGDAGINVRGLTYSTIADNICNANNHAGIELEDNGSNYCLYNRITGNTCRDDGSGANITSGSTWTQQYGILESGHSNYNLFFNNEVDSNGTAQLSTTGASSYLYSNTISGTIQGTVPTALLPSASTSALGIIQLDGTSSDIQPTSTSASAGSVGKAADAGHVHLQDSYGGMFGDGSDGSATLNGSNTVSWASLASSIYTMTRDCFCTSLTISNGVTLKPAGYRIYCAGAVANSGTISAIGGAGTAAGGAGSAVSAGIFAASAGGAGSTTTGATGGVSGLTLGVAQGGGGGAGSGNTAGGAGVVKLASASWAYRTPTVLQNPFLTFNGSTGIAGGGTGGGAGGGDGTNKGGGGGGGGGIIAIWAWSVNNSSGTISAAGGAGGTPTAGNCGGGGGGGGGLIIIFTLSAWTAGTTSVVGGALGSGVGTGSNASAGGNGTVLNVVVQ